MVRILAALIFIFAALAAPASAAVNGFNAADGDRACIAGEIDWDCLPAGTPVAEATDASGADDLGFTEGSKELQPGGWTLGAGEITGKSDLTRVWSAGEDTATTSYLYLAFETADSGGAAFMSFELNQLTPSENGLACRSDGDVRIAFETSGTNHLISPNVRIWAGDNDGGCSQNGTWNGPAAGAPAVTAEGQLIGTFGEVALDLGSVASHINTAKPCEVFRSVYTHTRAAGPTENSDMKDHVDGQTIAVAACAPPGGGGGGGDENTDPPLGPTLSAAASCDQDGTFTVTGSAQAGSQVLIYADGHAVASGTAAVNGAYSIVVTQDASSTHSYTARAFDEDGGSTSSFPVSVSAGPAPATPVVTSHPDGAVVDAGTVTLEGTAAAGATVTVTTPDGTPIETTTVAPDGTWSVELTGVEPGILQFRIAASSECGQSEPTAIMMLVAVDTSGGGGGGGEGDENTDAPGAPTLDGPTACEHDGVFALTGTAQPGSEVVIHDADGPIAAGHVGDDGTYSIEIIQDSATETYTATAHDEDGGSAHSDPVTVSAGSGPDAPVVSSPAAGTVVLPGDVLLSGSAAPGATVTVATPEGATLATTTAGDDGKWSAKVTGVEQGIREFAVRAANSCGESDATTHSLFVIPAIGGGGDGGDGGDGGILPGTGTDGTGTGGTGGDPDAGGVAGACKVKPFRVLISKGEKKVRRVVFKVDGRKLKKVRKRDKAGRFSTMVDPMKYGAGRHQVTAVLFQKNRKRRKVNVRSFASCEVGKCVSRRNFWMRFKEISGDPIVAARVKLEGKRVRTKKIGGRLTAKINLLGRPKGVYVARIRAVTKSGKVVKQKRIFRTCGLTAKKKSKR